MKKKKEPIQVQCIFSGEKEIGELLMSSFRLYVSREVARGQADAV